LLTLAFVKAFAEDYVSSKASVLEFFLNADLELEEVRIF